MIPSINNRTPKQARAALLALALLFALGACSDDTRTTGSEVSVVTTTSIVADWVENIGGEHVAVFSIVPAGGDPHGFQPGARDVAKIADADLVLSIGLGLEGSWLKELVENAARDSSSIVELGEAIDPIEFTGIDAHEDEHGHGVEDPHFWFDPVRVKTAVDVIAARLSTLDPERGAAYNANASAYGARLDELHAWTLEQVGVVPEERRLLLTSHDSLGYFANLYGFEVIGVIWGVSTEREPSAQDLVDLVEEVEEEGVPAVFGETTVSERLANAIASETGAKLVRLYSGALGGDGSGAETYIEMARTNASRIAEALR